MTILTTRFELFELSLLKVALLNFVSQNIRKHFIKNEVVNWDLGMHVYGYVLNVWSIVFFFSRDV